MNLSIPSGARCGFGKLRLPAYAITLCLLTACGSRTAETPVQPDSAARTPRPTAPPAEPDPSIPTTLANPASQRCIAEGGRLRIEKTPRGAEFGVCLFEDNYQCEEWALLRGECRKGGVRITGYATQAARYCAITGGRYRSTREETATTEEGGICTFANGKQCDVHAWFAGECSRE